jgi:hypothetical protein
MSPVAGDVDGQPYVEADKVGISTDVQAWSGDRREETTNTSKMAKFCSLDDLPFRLALSAPTAGRGRPQRLNALRRTIKHAGTDQAGPGRHRLL